MPFQKGNKLGSHGNHRRGFACWNRDLLKSLKWVQKDGVTQRVLGEEVEKLLAAGWVLGRPKPSAETKRKQSASHRGKDHPTAFKKGHQTWNRGDKMPEYAGINMSAAHLEKYGVTTEQIVEARAKNMSWCAHHKQFEANVVFHTLKSGRRASRCNACHNKHTPWYKQEFKKQGGVCGICEEPEPRLDALCVDHRHDCPDPKHTRKHEPRIGCTCTRGLLCSLCNPRFGYFENFISQTASAHFVEGSWEAKALAYLESYRGDNLSTFLNEKIVIEESFTV